MSPTVAVFGAGGFTGALAARLLARHPSFELRAVTGRSEVGRRLDELYPHHRVAMTLEELDLERHGQLDAAVVAYPHGAAAPLVKELRDRGMKVVDLSADFRLRDPSVYAEWYREHPEPELLGQAVYGLPELGYRERVGQADLVANPGCYPTATLLALAPLAGQGLIEDVVIDAKSGVSGAGRAATEKTHFVTVDENVWPYGVPRHRHTPEIEQELAVLGSEVRVTFTPHLLPLDQGELVSCYVTSPGLDGRELEELYHDRYADEPFIEVTRLPPGVRDVRETNLCRVSVHSDRRTGRVIAFACIDNLWKGAASQAVQNLNLMFGLPEGQGIS
ncbi:MAG TPA: N-acetyl-gamma-glutamyl-phosphate reductase [Solirubrobacteraceae bacterium]|nr:N-acetyl-gamma-glutamyl-phosphate reductase [Solirubrobacteraceae bacterium]